MPASACSVRPFSKSASLAAAAIVIVAMGMLFAGRTDRKRIDSAVNDPARPNGSAERSPANAERSDVPGAPGNGTAASATAPTDVVTILRQGQPDGEGTREGRAGQLSPADGHASRFAAPRQAARANAEIERQIRAPNPSALDPAEMPGRSGPAPTVVPRDDRPGGTASGRNPDSKATGGSAVSAPASGAASFDDLKSRLQGAIDVRAVAHAQRLLEEMLRAYPSAPDTEQLPHGGRPLAGGTCRCGHPGICRRHRASGRTNHAAPFPDRSRGGGSPSHDRCQRRGRKAHGLCRLSRFPRGHVVRRWQN